jgi:hypothetical protein
MSDDDLFNLDDVDDVDEFYNVADEWVDFPFGLYAELDDGFLA